MANSMGAHCMEMFLESINRNSPTMRYSFYATTFCNWMILYFLNVFDHIFLAPQPFQEEPVDKTKHWGDLEEEEEEEEEEEVEQEPEDEDLEDGIQSVDSLSRYGIEFLTICFSPFIFPHLC